MQGLGETLRQARLDKGASLADAQRETRIPRRYLEALETEDSAALEAPVYTRGFIRTYAEYLGLNPEAMLDLYQPSHRREPTPELSPAVPRVILPREIPVRPLVYVAAAIASVFVVAYLWTQLQTIAAAYREQEGLSPIRAASPALPPGVPTPLPIAALASPAIAVASPSPALPFPLPSPSPALEADVILVEIRTTARVYVEAAADGTRILSETLPAGAQRTFPAARDVVTMRVSSGSALQVSVNGRALEPVSSAGPVEFTWRR